jgi:lysozyme
LRKCPEFLRAFLLAALIAWGAASPALARHRHREPDRHRHSTPGIDVSRHSMRGIDVSHYQGTINWRAVASDDVAFAYIKATEGVDGRDAQFGRNWQGARHAGIRVGAYHYFIFCRSAREQARNFLAVAPRMASALPPAVDLEPARGCPVRLTGDEVRRELTAYLAIVETHERRHAVLYVTPQFYAAYGRYLPRRSMWRRSMLSTPPSNGSWTFWQYRSQGHVSGIRTYVDLNLVRSSRSASVL